MAVLRLKGYVDDAGELHFDAPLGLTPGEVMITVESANDDVDSDTYEPQYRAKTGAEIAASDVVGSWGHLDIEDSVAYVDEIRKHEREQRGW
jgi:hypothetical protein